MSLFLFNSCFFFFPLPCIVSVIMQIYLNVWRIQSFYSILFLFSEGHVTPPPLALSNSPTVSQQHTNTQTHKQAAFPRRRSNAGCLGSLTSDLLTDWGGGAQQ